MIHRDDHHPVTGQVIRQLNFDSRFAVPVGADLRGEGRQWVEISPDPNRGRFFCGLGSSCAIFSGRGSRGLTLTRREFDLLERLLASPGEVFDRQRLLAEAWGFESPVETNAVDVYVGYLRKKLEAEGEGRLIWTVRGVGYVLRENPI